MIAVTAILMALFAVIVLSLMFFGWWRQDCDEKRLDQQQPQSPACPCGCARVGKFCARCGLSEKLRSVRVVGHWLNPPAFIIDGERVEFHGFAKYCRSHGLDGHSQASRLMRIVQDETRQMKAETMAKPREPGAVWVKEGEPKSQMWMARQWMADALMKNQR